MNLCVQNHTPQLLRGHLLAILLLLLVGRIGGLKCLTPEFIQTRTLVRAHERPDTILLHTLHEKVRNPQTIEQVTRALVLITRIELQAQEVLNIRMPRFEVNRKRPVALASLIDILCCVVEDLEHRHNTRRLAIRSLDMTVTGTNVVNGQANTARPLGNLRTITECLVDALDGVVGHVDKEAGTQLRMIRSTVEESRRRMNEIPL